MLKTTLLLLAAATLFAQATRVCVLTWTNSTSSGVTGYNVYRADTPTGPKTKLNSTPIDPAGQTFSDPTIVVGNSYTYFVTATAPDCTPSTPIGTPCGESPFSTPVTTTVPPKPGLTVTLVAIVN